MIKMRLFVHFGRKDLCATSDVILTNFGQQDWHATYERLR